MPVHITTERYYQTLNRLFGITTATVLLLCLVILPFLPLTSINTFNYLLVVSSSALLAFLKYGWLKKYITYDTGYYITDILNPIMTGLLIYVSGRYGLYFYFIFFLQLMGSIALLRFKHVLVSSLAIGSISSYLFFAVDSFGLGTPERNMAGIIMLVVLFLMTVFSFAIFRQQINIVLQIKEQKTLFIQDVSHELRTPLTVIKGVAGMLKDGRWLITDANNHLLEYLQSATADLENITERLSLQSRQSISAEDYDKVTEAGSSKPVKPKAKKARKSRKSSASRG